MRKKLSSQRRFVRSFAGLAALFIILGAGNITFGRHKHFEYSRILSEAQAELASPKADPLRLGLASLSTDKQMQTQNRLLMRLDFYSFVVLGGQCFLAVGGLCLLICLLAGRKSSAAAVPHLPDSNSTT